MGRCWQLRQRRQRRNITQLTTVFVNFFDAVKALVVFVSSIFLLVAVEDRYLERDSLVRQWVGMTFGDRASGTLKAVRITGNLGKGLENHRPVITKNSRHSTCKPGIQKIQTNARARRHLEATYDVNDALYSTACIALTKCVRHKDTRQLF